MIKRLKDKRGVSMAEMIIAMTIITLVTAAAMTIMISSLRTTNRDFSEAEDQNFTSNAVACFTAAGSAEFFGQYMEELGYTTVIEGDAFVDGNNAVFYNLAGGREAKVSVSYHPNNGSGSLTIGIYEAGSDDPIDSMTFQKGAR